ncbi:MAG: ABC transporter ATP-binding protein [Candidatus Binatia bacterium]
MSKDTLLEIRNVSFCYENALVLKNITLSFEAGEFVSVIGPNGSGKTTLLKIILGLLRPTEGEVLLYGNPLLSYSSKEIARNIAYVSQEPLLTFPLTIYELVSLGRYPYSSLFKPARQDQQAVEDALRLTDALSSKDRKFTTLSGGEKQKALVARALAQSSRLLVLDEPTAHLDVYFQLQILKTLKKLCTEKQLAVVTVFHDLHLVSLFADKALLLKSGQLRAFGRVEEVLNEKSIKEAFGVDLIPRRDAESDTLYFFLRKSPP